MFEHYAIGMQVRSGADGASDELHLSPRQRPQELPESTEAVASSSMCAPVLDHNSSNLPQPIDSLAHELSKQRLIPEIRQLNTSVATGASPFIVTNLSMAPLEVDEDCNMDLALHDIKEHQHVADWKRARRQRYSRFVNNPNNAPAIEARVKDMISEESQCNVHPALSPLSLPSTVSTHPHLPKTEADDFPEVDSFASYLEVDEGICDESEEFALMQRALAADKARLMSSTPDSMRKFGPLRYRGSAETALRCHNVVRQRPRMRRRKGPGPTPEPRTVQKA
ncbi:hypothetical protein CSUB01_07084 [Colletotrichum sublineola]|uniref:Uncharacterized protein n=1 Tax=Colletotrichum sublineola TaxID=1173701 RepID=A0A066XF02_COLSU|nr:hypothetical protein CSUB01_07084 [Colletotrichum sublineola]